MSFSKIVHGKEEIFKVIIDDTDGRTIGKWVVMKKDFGDLVKIINKKYGLNLIIKKKEFKDLEWMP